ncbi:hypothetical protein ZOSMA_324G00130 [Zostera marina]|uniref:Uncharacterized protein n=1 Tax=Zostera marina TaxID=29655 RepID=A0A0K9P8Q0_ZOSMR|nr:hypothetical protein ZOSMA_324G00130 [Zostera marina]
MEPESEFTPTRDPSHSHPYLELLKITIKICFSSSGAAHLISSFYKTIFLSLFNKNENS